MVCALSGSPIHAQSAAPATQFKPCETFARPCQWSRLRDRFCILLSPSSQRMDPAPCESAAPATKSALDLAKVLRLPRNLYLTLRKCCACHATQTLRNLRAAVPMGPSPNPFRDRSKTVPRPRPYRRPRPRWFAHCPEAQFTHSASVSASCYLPARREWTQHLAKVLRLPRNLYLTLRKCCACHATQTLQNLRAAVPMGPSPNPFRTRSGTVPRPFRDRASRPRWFARRPEAQFTHSASVFCILPSPSSHKVDAAPCESAAPATKSILDLAKVLRLPRNLYLTLRKCCACHAIQTLRNLRAAVPRVPSPRPLRDRSETVPGPFRDRLHTGVATEVVCALSGSPIHAWHQRFCNLLSPSSQKVDAAPCESAAPATKSVLDLAKVLRLPRNLYLTLRKCCTCHAIQT